MWPFVCAVVGKGYLSLNYSEFFCILFGIILGIIFGWETASYGIFYGSVCGIAFGIGSGIGSEIRIGIVYGIILGTVYGFGCGFGVEINIGIELGSGLGVGIAFGIIFGIICGIGYGISSGLGVGIDVGIAFGICYVILFVIFYVIGLKIEELVELPEAFISTISGFLHPKELVENFSPGKAIASFLVFYIIFVLFFALWFYVCYLEGQPLSDMQNIGKKTWWYYIYSFLKSLSRFFIDLNRASIEKNTYFRTGDIRTPNFWHFVYFSFVTITTLGYGDISPIHIFPQVLVVLETLAGLGLIVFYLGMFFKVAGDIVSKKECV